MPGVARHRRGWRPIPGVKLADRWPDTRVDARGHWSERQRSDHDDMAPCCNPDGNELERGLHQPLILPFVVLVPS